MWEMYHNFLTHQDFLVSFLPIRSRNDITVICNKSPGEKGAESSKVEELSQILHRSSCIVHSKNNINIPKTEN